MMIQDGIDPPQIMVSLRQTDQLIDPLTTTDLRIGSMRRSTLASLRRKLYSRFSGSSRLKGLSVVQEVTGPKAFFRIRVFLLIKFPSWVPCPLTRLRSVRLSRSCCGCRPNKNKKHKWVGTWHWKIHSGSSRLKGLSVVQEVTGPKAFSRIRVFLLIKFPAWFPCLLTRLRSARLSRSCWSWHRALSYPLWAQTKQKQKT